MRVFDRYVEIERWMFDAALPFWAEAGVDRQFGGFIETLDFAGKDAGAPFKRVRVACRQIYVFSHAAVLGRPDYLPLADLGLDFLLERAWMADAGGFARRLTREGAVLDPTIDLYDHAFVVFALAWRARAGADSGQARPWLHRTLDAIEAKLARASGDGFWHASPRDGWLQQNPHMHLLEASLAAFEATGEARFADLARRIAALFRRHFLQPSGRLAEFFRDDWSLAPDPDGQITEPGHQFEWAWILGQLHRLLGLDLRPEALRLIATAERDGVDPRSGATYNAVDMRGAPLDRGSRTWPNTERLKAAIARFEIAGADPSAVFAESAGLLLDRYLTGPFPRGGWIDAFDAEGRPKADTMPTSTLYHLFLAFAEMLRVRGALPGSSS